MSVEVVKGAKHRLEGVPTAMGSLFIDSGAHSLYNREADTGSKRTDVLSLTEKYKFFDLKKGSDFRKFLEDYVAFIRAHKDSIDYYVTLDAIYNPQRTWDIQILLEEEYGLKPVPVVHCHAPMKWIAKYIDRGHRFIGIGGLGQGITKQAFLGWGDRVFHFLSPAPGKLPIVRTHGFAMTSWELLLRYPWYSVDSASWLKAAAFGQIYVPHKRDGKFVFTEAPYSISVSHESPNRKERGRHILNLSAAAQVIAGEWLTQIGMKLGKKNDKGEMIEWGVVSALDARCRANLLYFRALCEHLTYPREFMRSAQNAGFGLVGGGSNPQLPELSPSKRVRPMHVYFSGLSGGGNYPEAIIKEHAPDVMLSFDNLRDQAKKEEDARRATAWIRLKAHQRNLRKS